MMIKRPAFQTVKKQQGFTLVEVLVSAVLLAIGLLGLGALQGTAMKYTYSADLRSKAILLTYDMADRMRANMDFTNNTFNTAYDGISSDNTYSNKNCSQDDGTVTTAGCSVANMVLHDAYRWTSDISNKLPAGSSGEIALNNSLGGGVFYELKITWPDTTSTTGTSDFSLYIQP